MEVTGKTSAALEGGREDLDSFPPGALKNLPEPQGTALKFSRGTM